MPRALKTDSLGSAAQVLMVACFAQKLPASMIAAKIKAETGEIVAERTIGRRKAEWEAVQERRQRGMERMECLVAAARASNLTSSEMIEALARERLMEDPDGVLGMDPRIWLDAEKVHLQRDHLELKRRQIELDEKKFKSMEQREQKAIETTQALEKKAASGQTISPDDLRKIREVYGINT